VVREISDIVNLHRFDRESIMLGENSAASLMRYSLTPRLRGSRSASGLPFSQHLVMAG
jgi:hypothetical protein